MRARVRRACRRRGTAGRTRCRDRSARGCCARCRRACSRRGGGAASAGSCARRVSGDSKPARAGRAQEQRASTPTRSSLDHSPATNDSPAPISPRSSRRRNSRSSWTRTRASGAARVAEPDALARRQLEIERGRRASARAAGASAARRSSAPRRRHQPRQRDDQWMSDVRRHPRHTLLTDAADLGDDELRAGSVGGERGRWSAPRPAVRHAARGGASAPASG